MPSIHEMIRQELQAAKHFLLADMNSFALQEIEHAIMLLSIVHKKEGLPLTEAEGLSWYRKMAKEGKDEFSRKIFAKIAEDEVAHVEFFEVRGKQKLKDKQKEKEG